MPIPSAISDLSQTAASNSPAGSESPTTLDDYQRAHASFIALLRDGKGFATEATVASAATADIGAANSLYVQITGTTGITSFGANYNGPRFLRFAAALTLTHNATTLILPGAANITTAAGDTCIALPISGGWYVAQYVRASDPMTGRVIARAYAEYTTNAALTTAIPIDNTVPQNTEGTQIISVSFTPKTVTNRIRLRFQGEFGANATPCSVVAAVFSSASAGALRSVLITSPTADYATPIALEYEYVPGVTTALTFSVRVGPTTGFTMRMNGTTAGGFMGGTMGATLVIEEIAA
jgi:hypothetical protein